MKKLSTLILTGFTLSVIATTALASGNEYRDSHSDSDDDRYEYSDSDRYRDDDRGEYGKNYREHERGEKGDRYKDDDDRSSRFSEGENEFYGTIKQIPQGGLGTWVVGQREIFVDQKTRFENDYGQARVGSRVEVKGIYQNGTFHARKIETKD